LQGALFRGPDGDAGKVENVASAFNYNGAKGAGLGINAISGRRPPETGAKPAGQHFISASSKSLATVGVGARYPGNCRGFPIFYARYTTK